MAQSGSWKLPTPGRQAIRMLGLRVMDFWSKDNCLFPCKWSAGWQLLALRHKPAVRMVCTEAQNNMETQLGLALSTLRSTRKRLADRDRLPIPCHRKAWPT